MKQKCHHWFERQIGDATDNHQKDEHVHNTGAVDFIDPVMQTCLLAIGSQLQN